MRSVVELLKQESSNYTIQWKRAPLTIQYQQLRVANAELFLRYSQYDLQKMYNAGKLIPLSNHVAQRLTHTEYNQVRDLNVIKQIVDQSGEDYDAIIRQYKDGEQFAPTILRINTNKYYCVSGNSQLIVAKSLGIIPNIFLINLLPNRYTEVPQRNWE